MHMLYYRTVIGGEPRCQDAAVAQSVVRRIGSAEVTGPIPVSSFENPWGTRDFLLSKK